MKRPQKFRFPVLKVEVYLVYDIIARAPLSWYDYVINPANEALVGTQQPYFPVGGPVPPTPESGHTLSSSKWGGMDAGENMLYGVQVLDGVINDEAGTELQKYLQSLPEKYPFSDKVGQRIRCPTGEAILSPSFGSLMQYFGHIVHTVPPFYSESNWEQKLLNSYINSFRVAFRTSGSNRQGREDLYTGKADARAGKMHRGHYLNSASVASVLLGTGARGIPYEGLEFEDEKIKRWKKIA